MASALAGPFVSSRMCTAMRVSEKSWQSWNRHELLKFSRKLPPENGTRILLSLLLTLNEFNMRWWRQRKMESNNIIGRGDVVSFSSVCVCAFSCPITMHRFPFHLHYIRFVCEQGRQPTIYARHIVISSCISFAIFFHFSFSKYFARVFTIPNHQIVWIP